MCNFDIVDLVKINEEIKDLVDKPNIYEIEYGYPLEKLTPRSFELLLYSIFKAEIETGKCCEYSRVDIMSGVSEQGRDCILKSFNKTVAIVQCKHTQNIKTKIDEITIYDEVIKFILYYIRDNSLIPDLNNFTYYMVTNTDFTETSKTFFDDFSNNIKSNTQKTKRIILKIIKKYAKIDLKFSSQLMDNVIDITSKIKFKRYNGIDLNQLIATYDSKIAPLFFKVRGFIDTEVAYKILNILDTYIIPKDNVCTSNIKESLQKYLEWAYESYIYMQTLVFKDDRVLINVLYYPLSLVCKEDGRTYKIDGYPNYLFNTYNKVMISSSAGMGKSTIMKYMFISAIEEKIGIPIFIELKRLKSNNTILDEIIEKVKPISNNFKNEELLLLIEQGNFIFFLDGYDEINNDDVQIVTEDLQQFISKAYKNIFIVTSRPENVLGNFSSFQKFKVRDLKKNEAYQILRLYDKNRNKADELIDKIEGDALRNIKEFLKNPLLVSLLYMAYEFKPKIPYKKHLFYDQVYQALFEQHDFIKDHFERKKFSNLDESDFKKILRYVGFTTSKKNEVEFSKDVLLDFITDAKRNTGIHFKEYDFIRDLVKTVPLFAVDGNLYSWAHKSLQAFFSAEFIVISSGDKREEILKKIFELDDFSRFIDVLDNVYDLDSMVFKKTILTWFTDDIINFIDIAKMEDIQISNSMKVNRLEKIYGREILIKIFDVEKSKMLVSLGKDKLNWLHDDFEKNYLHNNADEYIIRYNLKGNNAIVLYIKDTHSKIELIKLLLDKSINIAEKNLNIFLDSKNTLPINQFIKVDFDKDNIVNSKSNFGYVNKLIGNGYTVNLYEVQKIKGMLDKEKNSIDTNDILDF